MSEENQPFLNHDDSTNPKDSATITMRVTEFIDYVVLESVFAINIVKNRTTMAIRKLRSTNPVVNAICNTCECVGRFIAHVVEFLIYAKTEPTCYSWIGLYEYGNQRTKDTYYLFKDELQDCVLSDFQEIFCGKYRDFCVTEEEPAERVIFAQVCPEIVRVKNVQTANPEKDIASIQPADFSFLSVNYYAGDFGPISIDIPKSHYMVGNELLSVGYVLRYLEYLPLYKTWHFNETYTLRIIDENIQTFELNETQWIVLTESGYDICKKPEPEPLDDLSSDDDSSVDDLSSNNDSSSDAESSTRDSSDDDYLTIINNDIDELSINELSTLETSMSLFPAKSKID